MSGILSTIALWGSIKLTDNFPSLSHPLPGLNTEEHSSPVAKMVTRSLASRHSGITPISQTMGAMDAHLCRWLEGQEPRSTPRGATLGNCQGPGLQVLTQLDTDHSGGVSERLDHILRLTHHCCRGFTPI